MPINLQEYNGRYVEILYGSTILVGKLVGNIIYRPILFTGGGSSWRLHVILLTDDSARPYEINPDNINAIRDITGELYEELCWEEKDDRNKNKSTYLERIRKTKVEIEEMRRR